MRTRIALATAVAVIAIPFLSIPTITSTPAASAIGTHDTAVSQYRTEDLTMNVMSYGQAHRVSQFVTFTEAVEAHEVQTYLEEVAYLKALAANSENVIPAAWLPTAMCEEGGRNDPVAGYFGILEWNGFDGYPTAGSAPLSVQLAWEAKYIGAPPDAPGRCHSY